MQGWTTIKTFRAIHIAFFMLIISMMSGCQDQSGRAGRPLIADFTRFPTADTSEDCTKFISKDFTECLSTCPDNQHAASEEELATLLDGLKETLGIDTTKEQELLELASASQGVCTDDIIRPTNKIKIVSDYCACKDSTPLILNNCSNFCSGRFTSGEETLFVNLTLDPEIALNPDLGSIRN